MKKILVPCDFSDTAVQAFRFACEIASMSKGEVFVLNVVEFPVLHSSMLVPVQLYEKSLIRALKEKASGNFEKIKKKWGGKVKIHLAVEPGSVAATIVKFVKKKKIDLIVAGTQGASGLPEFFIGSNAEKIVRLSTVPVFAIRKAVSISSIKSIVFPTTLQLDKVGVIAKVKELQSFFDATLHLLLVNTPHNLKRNEDERNQMEEYARHFQLKNYSLNIRNDFTEQGAIMGFAHEIKADMIAMTTQGRKGLNHLLRGSIAEDVVNHSKRPIWTLSQE